MSAKFRVGRILDTGITYLILIAVAAVFFFPCLWLILASFSKSGTIQSIPSMGFSQKNIVWQVFRSFLRIRLFTTIRGGFSIRCLWQLEAAF